MKPGDRDALRALVGADAVRAQRPQPVDGVAPEVRLVPSDAAALADTLRVLEERRLAALVCGGGTRLGLGNPPERGDVLLCTEALAGIDELDAEEGVVHLGAGTRLETLRDEARKAGWEPPLDAPGATSTVGGVLAAAATGPRCQGFGRPRDAVLGLEVCLSSGARTRSGGRVVKNVTGYDLQKLYTGSLGTLGVIEAAWLRLRPLPERVELVMVRLTAGYDPTVRGLEAAQMSAARAVAVLEPPLCGELDPGGRESLLVVELAGDAAVVKEDRKRLTFSLGTELGDAELLERVRHLQGASPGAMGVRIRVDALPSRLADAARPLRRAGALLLSYPGAGLLYARFQLDAADPGGTVAIRAAREAARAGGGGFVLEEAPLSVKQACDVFGDPPESLPLMRELKRQFDPHRVLNPGRFVGRI
jgi:glycolate oxidase FAD binding subunit